ncbi:unnamed protein product [Paramecium pentaurelia]|uniref:Uncharacterized protein n=1 Tax=Paramecium pentaurelia TaxID=43138 RepID=A0A8S1RZ64_9CILI|nr:unnamed protein product [Paramecium pentaurelia]
MKKIDIYNSYLRLTNRIFENSTPIRNLDQVQILNVYKQQQSHHPNILNSLRNKNSQSYKTLCSPSKIFSHTDTPDIIQNIKIKKDKQNQTLKELLIQVLKRLIQLNNLEYHKIYTTISIKRVSTKNQNVKQKLVLKNHKISILKLIYLLTKYKQLMVMQNMESLKHIKFIIYQDFD